MRYSLRKWRCDLTDSQRRLVTRDVRKATVASFMAKWWIVLTSNLLRYWENLTSRSMRTAALYHTYLLLEIYIHTKKSRFDPYDV